MLTKYRENPTGLIFTYNNFNVNKNLKLSDILVRQAKT